MEAEWYYALLRDFLSGTIPTSDFESRFLTAFKAEKLGMDSALYRILETTFGALDSYWEGWTSEEELPPMRITEKTLRSEIQDVCARLTAYVHHERKR